MMANPNIHTRYLEKDEYDRWDRFVDESVFGTIFHKTIWLKTFSEWQDLKFSIAACYKGEELIGGMAFTWKKKYNIIPVIQMPVKTPLFGPVLAVNDTKYRSKIENQLHTTSNALISFLVSEYKHVYASFPPAFSDIRPYIWKGFETNVHYTYFTELHRDTDLSESFDPDIRRRISKAEQLEYSVHINGSSEFIVYAWELEQKSFKRQDFHMVYASKNEFTSFIESLIDQDSAKIYTITHQNNPVATTIIILDQSKRIAYYWLAGADKEYLSTGLNQLLFHKMFENLIESGYKGFDFVGAGTESIARYKSTYNFPLVPMYSVIKSQGLAKFGMALKRLF